MEYTQLGHSGLVVSRLCFGCMTFGAPGGMPGITGVDEDTARTMVDRALAAGINFFDTADIYSGGASEQMLGRVLGPRRQDAVIATKVGFRTGDSLARAGLSRRHILASCDDSLRNLGTDHIDLYIAHVEDPFTPLEETLEAFDYLVRQGKVRYLGFSNWTAWRAAQAVQYQRDNGLAPFINGQMYYSLLGRDLEQDVVPCFQSAGIGMTVWSPLAGGFLSGKYTESGDREKGRLDSFSFPPVDPELGDRVVRRLRALSGELDMTPAQMALAWLMAKPAVAGILVGARRLAQLEDNLAVVDKPLPAEVVSELDAMTAIPHTYPNWHQAMLHDRERAQALRPWVDFARNASSGPFS